ncbi:MAG: segregation and condensation protein A [Angustibacter sp.]
MSLAAAPTGRGQAAPFTVKLAVFEGPFDLLLGLIAKHQLDITEVALARVTDEFIAHLRCGGAPWDLGQASEFLLVAATLLDLKAARLLPSASVEDEDDLELLEARDLLFARLLQYRAFKEVSRIFVELLDAAQLQHPRLSPRERRFSELRPPVLLQLSPAQLAELAAHALTPKIPPQIGLTHLHAPTVSVREQADVIAERLRHTDCTFTELIRDAPGAAVVIARFLALLELFRSAAVNFHQLEPLAELHIQWAGSRSATVTVTDEFDGESGTTADRPRLRA